MPSMNPIAFACQETIQLSPRAIVERIFALGNWRDFAGYGLLPGIEPLISLVLKTAIARH